MSFSKKCVFSLFLDEGDDEREFTAVSSAADGDGGHKSAEDSSVGDEGLTAAEDDGSQSGMASPRPDDDDEQMSQSERASRADYDIHGDVDAMSVGDEDEDVDVEVAESDKASVDDAEGRATCDQNVSVADDRYRSPVDSWTG